MERWKQLSVREINFVDNMLSERVDTSHFVADRNALMPVDEDSNFLKQIEILEKVVASSFTVILSAIVNNNTGESYLWFGYDQGLTTAEYFAERTKILEEVNKRLVLEGLSPLQMPSDDYDEYPHFI